MSLHQRQHRIESGSNAVLFCKGNFSVVQLLHNFAITYDVTIIGQTGHQNPLDFVSLFLNEDKTDYAYTSNLSP